MTRYGSADVGFLLVSGLDLLGHITTLNDELTAKTEETTPLGTAWETHAAIGVKAYKLNQEGFYDDGTSATNAALATVGASKVLSFALEGNTVGKRFIGSPMVQVNYKRLIERNALHKAKAEYLSEAGHAEGIILHPLGAETADSGDSTGADSQDNAASSATGGAGYLQVTALSLGGWTSATLKVLHSTDDVSYSALVTFANVTAAPTAERKAVTGTVNRYLAHSWLFNGAGGAKSITYFVGFARGS